MGNVELLDVGLVVKQEDSAITQFLLVRAQRTDEVAQTLWQHGDGAVDEIDTRSTLRGLLVNDRALLNIVRHVGNVHADLPEILHLAYRQRIVEVLGILGVDGTGPDVTEVLATTNLLFGDARLYLLGSSLHRFRIFIRQAVLRQNSVHLYIVVALLAEHVNDLAHNILRVLRGPLRNLDNGFLAILTALQLLLGNKDVMYEDVTLGDEEGIVFLHLQDTHGLVHLVRQDLDHHRLFDMLLATGHIGHLHPVAIHGKQRVALRDKDGRAAIVRQERVLAVGFANKGSLLHLGLQIQTIRIVGNLREIVVPRHLFHRIDGHHLGRMRHQFQGLEDVLQRECFVGMLLEEGLQHLYQHLLIQSFSTFFLTHSNPYYSFFGKDKKLF